MSLLLFRFHKTLEPGMNVLVPLIDKVKYVHSLKEITVDIPLQIAVTSGKTPCFGSVRSSRNANHHPFDCPIFIYPTYVFKLLSLRTLTLSILYRTGRA